MISPDLLPPEKTSWNQVLAKLPEAERDRIIAELVDDDVVHASTDWFLSSRREQIPPEWKWLFWLVMAGRGWGKNYCASNWFINCHIDGSAKSSGIIAATAEDMRRYCLEGPSGILSLAPKWFYPKHEPGNTRLVWPNGVITLLFTSEKPDRLRGPNLDKVLCDEMAAWRYLDETWRMLQLCLRFGEPQCLITTTPRPRKVLRDLVKREGQDVHITRGSTYDNASNLAPRFVAEIIKQFKGTRLERQEIYGELTDEFEGALWSHRLLDECRVEVEPNLLRIAVGVDPAITSEEDSDLTGIVAAGTDTNGHGYIIGDFSMRGSPDEWARKVIQVYTDLKADIIIAEKNQGGEMVESVIKAVDRFANVKLVHASRGKIVRAEPISALYEQRKVHHVGTFGDLEDQMCIFSPGVLNSSPDRVDALVWVLTELMGGKNHCAPWLRSLH